jgi:hypothetical protein
MNETKLPYSICAMYLKRQDANTLTVEHFHDLILVIHQVDYTTVTMIKLQYKLRSLSINTYGYHPNRAQTRHY